VKNVRIHRLLVLIPVLLIAACAKPPRAEMDAAAEAVSRAENDANAVTYAPSTLTRARTALTRMQEEADVKRYDSAKSYAAEAISAAERAIAEGKTGLERAKAEAARLVEGLQGPLLDAEAALRNARQIRGVTADLDNIGFDLQRARNSAGEAELDLAAGRYKEATAKAQSVRSSLNNITAALAVAVRPVVRKK